MKKHQNVLPYTIRWFVIRKVARWLLAFIVFVAFMSPYSHMFKSTSLALGVLFLLIAEIRFLYYYTSMSYCAHCLQGIGRDKRVLTDCIFNEAEDEYYHGSCYRAISAMRSEKGGRYV